MVLISLRCVRHRSAQPTRYAHEAMGEDGELHGVELSAEDALTVRAHSHADVASLCEAGLAAGFHQDGARAGKMESFFTLAFR